MKIIYQKRLQPLHWGLTFCLILLGLLASTASAFAEEEEIKIPAGIKKGTIGALFLQAPQEVFPTLSVERRIHALEDCQAVQRGEAPTKLPTNVFGISIKILTLTDSYLQMELDPQIELQMLKLPLRGWKQYLVALILTHSREGVATQSVIAFYDKAWQMQPLERWMKLPEARDFLQETSGQMSDREVKEALTQLVHPAYQISVRADARSLHLQLTSYEDARWELMPKTLEPWLKPIILKWHKQKGFIPSK